MVKYNAIAYKIEMTHPYINNSDHSALLWSPKFGPLGNIGDKTVQHFNLFSNIYHAFFIRHPHRGLFLVTSYYRPDSELKCRRDMIRVYLS